MARNGIVGLPFIFASVLLLNIVEAIFKSAFGPTSEPPFDVFEVAIVAIGVPVCVG